MPSPAPAPRLPLEPADRPLYQPPRRLGCSGVTLVSIVTLLAFLFFLRFVAPAITDQLAAIQVPGVLVPDVATPTTTADEGSLSADVTPLPAPELTPQPPAPPATDTPIPSPPLAPNTPSAPTPTPAPAPPEYVVVGNTDGTGVYLRAEARQDGRRNVALPDKTLLVIIGPNVTVEGHDWRNVRTTKENPVSGWILAQYLLPATAP